MSKTVDTQTITNSYSYENDRIKSITHNGFDYNFEYDPLGNNTKVGVGTQNLIKNVFDAETGNLSSSTYGNEKVLNDKDQTIEYKYDTSERLISSKYKGVDRFKYDYDASGNLAKHEDLVNGVNYRYIYDMSDRLVKIVDSKGNTIKNIYDTNSNISSVSDNINSVDHSTSYTYNNENKPKSTNYKGNVLTNNYDSLGRLQGKVTNTGTAQINTSYEFEDGKDVDTSTDRVSKLTNNGKVTVYTYDKNGNIETITEENGKKIKYYYNELDELIREDNQVLNKTITNAYDSGGNILNKVEYAYTDGALGTATKTFTYAYGDANWKDKLTSFNDGTAKPITYDAIGNPLTYNGYTYTWEEGRQLATMSGNGNTIVYKYNDSGIRTQKTVNGVITNYHLVGDKVTFETNGTDNIYYTYDSSDTLVSMNLNGVEYYYIRNAQGDIIALHDNKGVEAVNYSYDSWGKLISTTGDLTVGVKNPYRYRGYRYDTETSLYYLQSRYYNADWGRFVNGDDTAVLQLAQGQLLGANLFTYCMNNPVVNSDPSGYLHLGKRWWFNSRWAITIAIDTLLNFLPVLGELNKAIKIGKLFKLGRVYIRENIDKALKRVKLNLSKSLLNAVVSQILYVVGGSIGGGIAWALDRADGKSDGWILP